MTGQYVAGVGSLQRFAVAGAQTHQVCEFSNLVSVLLLVP